MTFVPGKYKVRRQEEEIKPEETLIDSVSEYSSMEVPISRGVFGSFFIFIIAVIALFAFKAFQMQFIHGKYYAALAERSSNAEYPLSSLRGIIYDTRGQALVENIPVFDLIALHAYLPRSDAELNREIGLLSPLINIDIEILAAAFKNNQNKAVFVIKRDLSKEEVVKVKNLSLAGIYPVTNSERYYPDGPAVAHILGYTTAVSAEDLKRDSYYLLTDQVGRLGLEAQYEKILRGEHRSFDTKNESDNLESSAIPGQNLVLNIDREVQAHLYQSVVSVFNSAGVRRGAAVIQNPKTGAVLGLVSMPSFNGNIFENSSRASEFSGVAKILSSSDKPMLNRVVSGRYHPGSTIKPLLALAGLKEGVITPATLVFANGSITVKSEVDPNVVYTFRDWRVHGWTDLKKAIANSVDVYFYTLGGGYGNIQGLGIDRIANYIKGLGADKTTGIDLPGELSGFVPSKTWKQETKGEAWHVGDTYNVSIGQGDLVVTPLWLNTYVGSVANGGKLMKPFLVREVKDPEGGIVSQVSAQILGETPFDQKTIGTVKEGMRQTVLSGTATLLQDLPVPVAAKTGTAQVTGRGLNSLFTVFGPYDDPEIVMTVLVENINQSQGLAIRVANDFLLWYFNRLKK